VAEDPQQTDLSVLLGFGLSALLVWSGCVTEEGLSDGLALYSTKPRGSVKRVDLCVRLVLCVCWCVLVGFCVVVFTFSTRAYPGL
jgi:hypothetical protein